MWKQTARDEFGGNQLPSSPGKIAGMDKIYLASIWAQSGDNVSNFLGRFRVLFFSLCDYSITFLLNPPIELPSDLIFLLCSCFNEPLSQLRKRGFQPLFPE